MEKLTFKGWQRKTFLLCWIVYAFVYLGRVNISVAIPEIQATLGFTKAQVGMIGSVFFWIYGVGHLINGYIGDKVSSRKYIFISLILSGLINIFFGFSASLITMIILWGLNGYVQSMVWGPMIKTLSFWFENNQRGKIATAISTSMVGGYFLAWGLVGVVIGKSNWNWAFWLPGICILIYAVIWFLFLKDKPEDVGFKSPNEEITSSKNIQNNEDKTNNSIGLLQLLNKYKLWFIVVVCIAKGIIKEGISLWGPTFLMETQGLNLKATISLILLIPLMNFFGMIFTGWLSKKYNDKDYLTIITLFLISIITNLCLIKMGHLSAVLGLLFIGISSATMYGSNTILMGAIPMKYAKYNKTSSIAGFLDFISYMAAGFSVSLTGLIVDKFGWNGVLILWISTAVLAVVSMFFYRYFNNKMEIVTN